MFTKQSLRLKLFLSITLVVLITFGCVSAFVSYRSIEMAEEDAYLLADEIAGKYSYQIKSELQAVRVTSESIMTVFKTLIERGEADRDTFNAIQQAALWQKDYIVSFCVAFEPNKLDGKDAEYAGQFPLYDETGRYAPYWNLVDGKMDVRPLTDFYSDWYTGAKKTKAEFITDPFFFEVQGEQVLMSSLVFPVIIDDEFIGIVSADMTLDALQKMVSESNTSGLNEFTEIYSNAGVLAAHPDDHYFNKSIYATSAYRMLTTEPAKAKEALPIATKYAETLPLPKPPAYPLENMAEEEQAAKYEAEQANYENAQAFVKNLTAYTADPDKTELDLTLLPNDMAKEILTLDEGRMEIAAAATAAVEKGEKYTVTEDGYYKIYMPVRFSEATRPWSVAVNLPMSSVMAKADSIRDYVIIVSALGFGIIAFLLYMITRNMTQPILDLADAAQEIGEGNFDTTLPATKNKDEVGTLYAAFKTMIQRINELITKLTQNSQELEIKNRNLGELNEMLAAAKDEAEASNQAKTMFLSNMSHEMRTPLNAITGMTTIGRQARESDKKDDAFGKIEEASGHLLTLVNDVLDMSKMEAGKLELAPAPFSLGTLVADARGMVSPQIAEKHQTLTTELDPALPAVLIGDDFRLGQVMINLLSNAVKFTPEGGNISLTASLAERTGDEVTIAVAVTDTGIGISAEQQQKLFRLFEQADNSTSRSFGGTGLGLALSQRIVELMGGEIGVASELGEGSTFTFTARLKVGDDDDLAEKTIDTDSDAAPTADFSDKHLLLAEDVEINRVIVQSMLAVTGVSIDCATNGQEAYDLFHANPGKYDAILMDIQMPVLDGLGATGLIRAEDQDIPIIAMTANVFKEDVENYLKNGINDHIGKPLDFGLTIAMLKKYLERT